VTDGYETITPVDEIVVTITGHHDTAEYDGEDHSVSGYDVEISNPLYKEADFTFSGTAEAARINAGTTSMGLAANQFAIACMRTQLSEVATEEAFERMFAGLDRLAKGLEAVLTKHNVPWSLTRSGARCELQFMPTMPVNGTDAKNNFDWDLMYYTHLYLHNRGIIITPFHNMMLVSPVTTDEDIDRLIQGWDNCIAELAEIGTYNR
jgi:glutamate-1-semialdehyde 2,1-aminomutase